MRCWDSRMATSMTPWASAVALTGRLQGDKDAEAGFVPTLNGMGWPGDGRMLPRRAMARTRWKPCPDPAREAQAISTIEEHMEPEIPLDVPQDESVHHGGMLPCALHPSCCSSRSAARGAHQARDSPPPRHSLPGRDVSARRRARLPRHPRPWWTHARRAASRRPCGCP